MNYEYLNHLSQVLKEELETFETIVARIKQLPCEECKNHFEEIYNASYCIKDDQELINAITAINERDSFQTEPHYFHPDADKTLKTIKSTVAILCDELHLDGLVFYSNPIYFYDLNQYIAEAKNIAAIAEQLTTLPAQLNNTEMAHNS